MTTKALPAAPTLVSDEDFQRVLLRHRDAVRKLEERLESRDLDAASFVDELFEILTEAHTDGWMLGRQRAGDLRGRVDDDLLFGRTAADGEIPFLERLRSRLSDAHPRYFDEDGNLTARLSSDLDLYVRKMRATAAEAFVEASEIDEEFAWVLGAFEEHCSDCPELAALSPFRRDELWTFPGQGDTPCLGNCYCHLVRVTDGVSTFAAVR